MVPKGVRQRSHPARMQLTQFARFSVNFEKPQYAQTAVSSPRPSREWSAPFLKVPLGGAFGIGSQLLAYHFIRYLEESLLRSRRDCRSGGGMMTAPLSPTALLAACMTAARSRPRATSFRVVRAHTLI